MVLKSNFFKILEIPRIQAGPYYSASVNGVMNRLERDCVWCSTLIIERDFTAGARSVLV